jgi:heme exporter protein C
MTTSVNSSPADTAPSTLGPRPGPAEGRGPKAEGPRSSRGLARLGTASFIALALAQAYYLAVSPADRMMGHLQKIMYVHVPTAWVAFVAFTVVFVASILYLWKREERHDRLALAAAEIGTLLTAVTLVLGSLWGKPTWGVWWTWDPRLTTTAILLMIFAGYLALRAFVEDQEQAARWSAAVGILGFVNVPVVYMSVRWWRTLHQAQSTRASLDSVYWTGMLVNAVVLLAVLWYLIARRAEVARLERAAEDAADARALGAEAYGAAHGGTRL